MNERRDSAINEHTQNVRSGLMVLKTKYGITVDEYDYVDLAIDALRNINTYGTTEYYSVVVVDDKGELPAPCNLSFIDAVVRYDQGFKQFNSRLPYDMVSKYGTDAYFTAREVRTSLDWRWDNTIEGGSGYGYSSGYYNYNYNQAGPYDVLPEEKGYIPYQLGEDKIIVGKKYSGVTLVVAFTGITVDNDGYPMVTRKQANAIAAYVGKYTILKEAAKGNTKKSSLLEFFIGESARLIQAASIPENITDNELDAVLDAQTTFNRKSYNRPTGYSR